MHHMTLVGIFTSKHYNGIEETSTLGRKNVEFLGLTSVTNR